MTTFDIETGENLHPGQLEIFESPARYRVADCGRKFGKSILLKTITADGVGQKLRIAYATPTNRMLMDMWRAVKNMLSPIVADKNEQEHRIETINGAVVEMWSLDNPDGPRPFEYDLFIVDEAAFVPNIGEVWDSVIRPTLMKRHGRAVFASTPCGYNGFWTMFSLGQDPLETEWKSWQKPSWDNPFLDKAEIEKIRRITPANIFSQEYEAQFISDAGAVFRYIDKAATAVEQEEAIEGHTYIIGVDLAKTNDFSVFAVIDTTIMSLVKLDRANHVDYKLQRQRLVTLANKFRAAGVVVEENTNLAFMETLVDTGLPVIPFTTGVGTKAMIIEALAGAFDNSLLKIIPDPQLLNELKAYQMERLPSGMFRYGGPREINDDTVMATALAYHGAAYGVPTWKIEVIDMLPEQQPGPEASLFAPESWPTIQSENVLWPVAEYIFAEPDTKLATDILVRTANPRMLDKLLRDDFRSSLVEDSPGIYHQVDGCYVARCFGNTAYVKFAIQQQGYAQVVQELGVVL